MPSALAAERTKRLSAQADTPDAQLAVRAYGDALQTLLDGAADVDRSLTYWRDVERRDGSAAAQLLFSAPADDAPLTRQACRDGSTASGRTSTSGIRGRSSIDYGPASTRRPSPCSAARLCA